jgi:hypothetical protein
MELPREVATPIRYKAYIRHGVDHPIHNQVVNAVDLTCRVHVRDWATHPTESIENPFPVAARRFKGALSAAGRVQADGPFEPAIGGDTGLAAHIATLKRRVIESNDSRWDRARRDRLRHMFFRPSDVLFRWHVLASSSESNRNTSESKCASPRASNDTTMICGEWLNFDIRALFLPSMRPPAES